MDSSGASCNLWKWGGLSVLLSLAVFFLRRHLRTLYLSILCLPRDAKLLYLVFKIGLKLFRFQLQDVSVPQLLDKTVEENPSKVLIYYEDEEWTAQQIQKMSHQVANFFLSEGMKRGDVIGLFMENQPQFVPIWIGLARIGCRTALLNTSLRGQSLRHCVTSVNCSAIIFNSQLGPAVDEAKNCSTDLDTIKLYHFGEQPAILCPSKDLRTALENVSGKRSPTHSKLGFNDPMLYVFTSGTTGLPKAAIIKNSRFLFGITAAYYFSGFLKSDRINTSLPMYHISGIGTTSGLTCIFGIPVILRRKFSAANFWTDCIKYEATVGHYIGELCRYILAQKPSPEEKAHKVRLMFGNGVRPDVWEAFQRRFGIKDFREFYGATEGNCNMTNFTGKVGAIGFVPFYFEWMLPKKLIRIDEMTGAPLRDPQSGSVIVCEEDEAGELITKIKKGNPIGDFEGYADKTASESKILRDAFRKGDAWFRSGDMLTKDKYGFFYFKDRMGDTFRWKGENCSTTEIESVLIKLCGLQDVVVFGVNVPGAEGKAGMGVVCDVGGSLNLPWLTAEMDKVLPKYAQPLFLRVSSESADITGTFKLKKTEYEKVGYNLRLTSDPIFFLRDNCYVRMDDELYRSILQGNMRL